MRNIKYIVVHTSATRPSMDIGRKEINLWHKQKGWAGIGYHYVIRRDGTVEKGRAESRIGAHVANHNRNSIGICLVGGLNERTLKPEKNYTPEQMESLLSILQRLTKKYTDSVVLGHRDFRGVAKACPCFDVIPLAKKWKLPVPSRRDKNLRKTWRQSAREILTPNKRITAAGMSSVGFTLQSSGELLQEQYQLSWLPIVGTALLLGGIALIIWSKFSDANEDPKYPGVSPLDDSID